MCKELLPIGSVVLIGNSKKKSNDSRGVPKILMQYGIIRVLFSQRDI